MPTWPTKSQNEAHAVLGCFVKTWARIDGPAASANLVKTLEQKSNNAVLECFVWKKEQVAQE